METQSRAGSTPAWFDESAVAAVIDADKMLDRGVHPLETVGAALKDLKEGELLKLTASFVPAPLIEKFTAKGYLNWTRRTASGLVECFFAKPQ